MYQDNLELDRARVWAATKGAFLDVWLGRIAVLLNLNATSDKDHWITRSRGHCLQNEKHCASQSGHIVLPTFSFEMWSDVIIITTAEKYAFFAWLESRLFVCYNIAKKRTMKKILQMERVKILSFSVFFGHGHQQHMGAKLKMGSRLHFQAYFILYHAFIQDAIFSYGVRISISPLPSIQPWWCERQYCYSFECYTLVWITNIV